jgi:hypothetical protein
VLRAHRLIPKPVRHPPIVQLEEVTNGYVPKSMSSIAVCVCPCVYAPLSYKCMRT